MAALPYTKKMFLQAIRKHIGNRKFSNDEFNVSDNELILYIDRALAFRIVGKAYENAKIEGVLTIDEGFITTYALSLSQDSLTQEWIATLPQPPIGLPLGYSVNRVYFSINGQPSVDALPIEAKRTAYRNLLPDMGGLKYRVTNKELRIRSGESPLMLYGYTVYVEMPSARTTDKNEVMNVPPDELQPVFDMVIKELAQRYGMPYDQIKDDLPAGNKGS